MRTTYESDDAIFDADAYTVTGHAGIAWYVLGWETAPLNVWACCDCDASGYEREHGGGGTYDKGDATCDHNDLTWDSDTERTGQVVAVMVGDDQRWTFDADDVTPLAREAYCGECGQVGCTHDGLEREGVRS